MKQLKNVMVLAAFSLFFASCEKVVGEGPIVTEQRNVTNFSGVDLRVSGNVFYTQAAEYKVEVKAQQNIMDILETYTSGNKLVIKLENNTRIKRHEDIEVHVSSPDVRSLRISGSGNVKTVGNITATNMDVDISGSGSILIANLTADYLDVNISGSGDMEALHGTVREEKLKISGSGNINLSNVAAREVTTTTSGSGNTRVNATERLNITISGSGSVYYKGQPAVNTSISGSGKVRQL